MVVNAILIFLGTRLHEQNCVGYQESEGAIIWKLLHMFMMTKGGLAT